MKGLSQIQIVFYVKYQGLKVPAMAVVSSSKNQAILTPTQLPMKVILTPPVQRPLQLGYSDIQIVARKALATLLKNKVNNVDFTKVEYTTQMNNRSKLHNVQLIRVYAVFLSLSTLNDYFKNSRSFRIPKIDPNTGKESLVYVTHRKVPYVLTKNYTSLNTSLTITKLMELPTTSSSSKSSSSSLLQNIGSIASNLAKKIPITSPKRKNMSPNIMNTLQNVFRK